MNILSYSSLVGSFAATFTTLAFVPQAYRSYKTRDLSGISLPMYSIFTAGVGLWSLYGFMLKNWPIIIANTITFALSAMILVLKIKEKR